MVDIHALKQYVAEARPLTIQPPLSQREGLQLVELDLQVEAACHFHGKVVGKASLFSILIGLWIPLLYVFMGAGSARTLTLIFAGCLFVYYFRVVFAGMLIEKYAPMWFCMQQALRLINDPALANDPLMPAFARGILHTAYAGNLWRPSHGKRNIA